VTHRVSQDFARRLAHGAPREFVEVRTRRFVAHGHEALAVCRVAEVEAVARVAAQVVNGVRARGDGEGLERLGLGLDAALGGQHAEDVIFEREPERRVAARQTHAHRAACVFVGRALIAGRV
jgi:hypothetical protein